MNIKNEKFLFSVVLIGVSINLFLHKTSFSQEGGEVWYNVVSVPPSPNAAALGKYGEIPVDKSTGIPNISIPILDLSEGGIDVSVSLSYHAGGIRVQDEATWVGLGWSLNAGGVITRTMRGLPDDHYNGFLENAEKVPSSGMIYNELSTPGIATTAYNRVNEIAKGYLDYEPDLFYYNYGKGSGSFMFGNHNQPINIPFDDVIIEPLYDSGILSGFILTAPDGIVYIFGNGTDYTETTHVEIEGPNPQDYISSWYLHQIINPLKNTDIYFDYESQPYSQGINYSATRMYEHDGFNYIPHSPDINPCNTDIDAKYLKLIGFKNGVITFNSSDSEDGGRKLDSIMFVTPISGTRKFKFNYDYFKVDYNSTLREELRLRLLSFIETYPYLERNLSLKNDKKYSFDYSPINLPPKTSNAIDYWGFFNGVTLNVNTIPKVLYGGLLLGDADREPDTTYSCAGVLTKINYPTGGSSEFKYENNAYGRLPTVEEITSPGGFEFFIVKGIEEHTEICETEPLHFDTNYNYINFVLHAEISINGTYDPTHHKGKVQILWDNGEVLFTADLIKDNPIVVPLENIDLTDMCVLKLCANGSVTTATAWITYEKYDPDELQIKREYLAGGLRIKEIKNYDHVTNKSTYKTFDYDKSGYLNTSFPSYYTLTTKRWAEPPCLLWYDRSIIMVYSSPIGGLGNSSNSVSYEKVIEYNGTTQVNNGKLVSTFLKYEDDPTGGMPYLPHLSYQYLRSKVLREEYFNFQAENNYGLIKQIDYEYEYDTNHLYMIRGFKASRIMTVSSCIHDEADYVEEFSCQNFMIFTYNNRLKNVITHDLTSGGGEIITKQDYFYDNRHHLNPTRIFTNSSDGKVIKTVLKYPLDYVSCINNCDADFELFLDSCNTTYNQNLASDLGDCAEIYGTCWGQFLINWEAHEDCYWASMYDPIGYVLRKCKSANHVFRDLRDCLASNGYTNCLDGIDRGYIPCQVEANITFNDCIDNYYLCINDLYNDATDPFNRGIYLLALCYFHNTLIEKIVYSDDQEIEHYKFNYSEYETTHKPKLVKAEKEINGEGFTTEMVYNEYDDRLNILQTSPFGIGTPSSVIWGYGGLYPVILGQNVTFDDLNTAVNASGSLSNLLYIIGDLRSDSQKAEWSHFNSTLRNNSLLNNSLITTYTYKPLIGLTSQTDSKGISSYYEYDNFGRLSNIRDNNSNILQHFEYNYQQYQLEINPSNLYFESEGGSQTVQITSNSNWQVTEDLPWLSISPTSGNFNGSILITCEENNTPEERSDQFMVHCEEISKSITVTQSAIHHLSVSPKDVNFSYDGGYKTFEVDANVIWTVQVVPGADFIRIIDQDENTFTIECYEQPVGGLFRHGQIDISGEGVATFTVFVTQDAYPN